jgi:peptidoglycan/LPS O-acetylase OafA/YrhL
MNPTPRPAARTAQGLWHSTVSFFQSQREVDLDVVRGIAILLAIGWHLNASTQTVFDWLLYPGARIGWAGVDLFFVLSGFLVGRMLLKERAGFGRVDLRVFYVRRIVRLWPVLYVFLFAMLILSGLSYKTYFFQIALHVQNYYHTQVAAHLWSLAVEEQFYVVASIGLSLTNRYRATNRHFLFVLLAIPVIALALRYRAALAGVSAEDIQQQFQFRMDALSAGVTLALIPIAYPARFECMLSWRWLWTLSAVAGFGVLTLSDKATRVGETVGYTIAWAASAALLLAVYRSGIERRARVVSTILSFFGLIAYPLYLWHVPAARITAALFVRLHWDHPVLRILAAYASAVVIAVVMRATIELPLMLWRDRITPARAEPVSV